jgi:hypothetical protein
MNKRIGSDVGINFDTLKQTNTKKLHQPKEKKMFFALFDSTRKKVIVLSRKLKDTLTDSNLAIVEYKFLF